MAKPTIGVMPSSSIITTKEQLQVEVVVDGESEAPRPAGAVTLTSGSYKSAAVALNNGRATITIPAGSLALGIDKLTVSYSGNGNYLDGEGAASVKVKD
jgi:hypothetical protein